MFRWTTIKRGSKDIILINPEEIDSRTFDAIYEDIQENRVGNYQEISRTMMNGNVRFHEGYKQKKSMLVLEHNYYRRMLRWIITSGNLKYDSPRFYLWRDALRKLWRYLFGDNFHEFRIY